MSPIFLPGGTFRRMERVYPVTGGIMKHPAKRPERSKNSSSSWAGHFIRAIYGDLQRQLPKSDAVTVSSRLSRIGA